MRRIETDILILGMGGAGELAALTAYDANPELRITVVTKALRGKGGCSRMVQGGFNVVLNEADSHDKHLMDTLRGGQFINNQELAKTLVEEATPTIKEMETKYGCFFDRNQDGTVHQKPFAGQSYDRTVHKGDLTGIEIISRLTEQVMARDIQILEEHRALDLLTSADDSEVTGALLLDIPRGGLVTVEAKATLVATGGGPTNYRFSAPGPEKSLDGLGMLARVGASMLDMEMIQFHPTGLIIPGSVVAGSLLEEGLRGAGAHLLNAEGERYMGRYDPKAERATRDVVSRSSFLEMMEGRGLPGGGVHIVASHLGADFVEKNFPGMCLRCSTFGYDLARKPVPVSPTAHFVMGGAEIDTDCQTSLGRLFCAGEDAGGVHGANRLGGNGICDSCVYGRRAGMVMARRVASDLAGMPETKAGLVDELQAKYLEPFNRPAGPGPYELRSRLRETNWTKVGIARTEDDLIAAAEEIDTLQEETHTVRLDGAKPFNMVWNDWINLGNMLDVSRLTARSAQRRNEKRGAHFRLDHPDQDDGYGLFNTFVRVTPSGELVFTQRPVALTYARPDQPGD